MARYKAIKGKVNESNLISYLVGRSFYYTLSTHTLLACDSLLPKFYLTRSIHLFPYIIHHLQGMSLKRLSELLTTRPSSNTKASSCLL